MKKLIPLFLGLIIGAVITYYFCPRVVTDANEGVENPTGTITIIEAENLSANWEKYNETEIDSTIEVEGSRKQMRSGAWTLKNIEDYLYFAKKESEIIGYTMTGLRVYLGNYGGKSKGSNKNRNTLFIAPTGHKNTEGVKSLKGDVLGDDGDVVLPIDPLNDAAGGEDGYPQ